MKVISDPRDTDVDWEIGRSGEKKKRGRDDEERFFLKEREEMANIYCGLVFQEVAWLKGRERKREKRGGQWRKRKNNLRDC